MADEPRQYAHRGKRDEGVARLAALTGNALNGQWSPKAAIDWDVGVAIPWWIPNKTYVAIVSQLYYAEIAALRMCRRLLDEVPEPEARRFLDTQAADEARHARVYRAYLARLGDIAPIDEALATALEGGLEWPGSYHGVLVACHVVLEGEAVRLQNKLSEIFPCPLFRQINAKISRDEARHVAFGKIYLRDKLKALALDERIEIYRWVQGLWRTCTRANDGCHLSPASVVIRLSRSRLHRRWHKQARALSDIGLISDDEALLA